MLTTRNRHGIMMQKTMLKLLEHYKSMLIALFEYYLYDTYGDNFKLLDENCLPYSAIADFYNDFAAGESARMNRITLRETVSSVVGVETSILEEQEAIDA